MELRRLAVDALGEHRHQALHLGRGARPVLGGERVDGELVHAQLHGVAQAGLDHVGSGAVALDDGEAAALGPAAVPVDDDRDVRARDSTAQ